MRRLGVVVVLAVAGLVLPGAAQGATKDVTVADNSFSPATAKVKVGDTVHWTRTGSGNAHNIVQDAGLFDSGTPDAGAISFSVVFSAGTFPYHCEVHGGAGGVGMSGVVKVPVGFARKPAGRPFTVRWAKAGTETGGRFRVRYRVDGGAWEIWKSRTSARSGVFGKNGKPEPAVNGSTYTFRAKSKGGGGSSRWSPARSFTV